MKQDIVILTPKQLRKIKIAYLLSSRHELILHKRKQCTIIKNVAVALQATDISFSQLSTFKYTVLYTPSRSATVTVYVYHNTSPQQITSQRKATFRCAHKQREQCQYTLSLPQCLSTNQKSRKNGFRDNQQQ